MNFCTYCNKEFLTSVKEHLYKHYLEQEKKSNKGNILCPLCKIRVGKLSSHYFSKLHRYNVLKPEVLFEYSINDFKTHFDSVVEVRKKEIMTREDDPFWITAKEQLSVSNYNKLRRNIYENQKPRRRSRIKSRGRARTKHRRRTSKN